VFVLLTNHKGMVSCYMKKMIEPPFNYTGSKFKMLEQIIPLFDPTCSRFVDVFAGGGSVYANVVDHYPAVVANDIIYHLIDVQRRLVSDPAATIAMTQSLCVTKEDQPGYHRLRDDFNAQPTPEKLWALMCCCTNNMMRFNRSWKFNQTFGRRTFNERTLAKATAFAAHLMPHLPKLTFQSLDFEKVNVQSGDMLYVDPPYSNTEAGYNAYWNKNDDVRLFNWLCQVHDKGAKFAVSGVTIHAGVRCRLLDLLAETGFVGVPLQGDYNKVSRSGPKEDTQEVLMLSYVPETFKPVSIKMPAPQQNIEPTALVALDMALA